MVVVMGVHPQQGGGDGGDGGDGGRGCTPTGDGEGWRSGNK